MTKYRVIHIPTGEWFETTDEELEEARQLHSKSSDPLPNNLFDQFIAKGCSVLPDEPCFARKCRVCPWNHKADYGRIVEEIEYMIEEIK